MVLRPSLPPAICTTINVRSVAACAICEPSCACDMAEATPRLKMVGIIIPAETANMPSFIIALRESFIIGNAPLCQGDREGCLYPLNAGPVLLIEMIFRRGHHQVECAAHAIERIALTAVQGDLGGASTAITGGEVVNQLRPAVAIKRAIIQERCKVIDKVVWRCDLILINNSLKIYRRSCARFSFRCAAYQQQIQIGRA